MIYDRYAAVYDGSGQIRFALLIAQYIEDLLKRHPVSGSNALDLACGTGTLALALAEAGWQVTGVDQSAAMLAQARTRAVAARPTRSLRFLQADMRSFDRHFPPAAFQLITCTYDSLNYLVSPADIDACLQAVAASLAPGGLFIADLNTRYFLEHGWERCSVLEQTGYTQVMRSTFDAAVDTITVQLTGFIGNDQLGYERFDEVHVERAYDVETLTAFIAQTGLQSEAFYDCFTFTAPSAQSCRIVLVARKPAASQPAPDRSAACQGQGLL